MAVAGLLDQVQELTDSFEIKHLRNGTHILPCGFLNVFRQCSFFIHWQLCAVDLVRFDTAFNYQLKWVQCCERNDFAFAWFLLDQFGRHLRIQSAFEVLGEVEGNVNFWDVSSVWIINILKDLKAHCTITTQSLHACYTGHTSVLLEGLLQQIGLVA